MEDILGSSAGVCIMDHLISERILFNCVTIHHQLESPLPLSVIHWERIITTLSNLCVVWQLQR